MKKLILFLVFGAVLLSCTNENSNLGDKYFQSGEYQKAVDAYSEYIKLQPRHVKSIYNRGRAYQELGKHEEALADFEKVIKEDPLNFNAYLSITSDYYYRLQDYENTIFFADKILELNEDNALAHTLKGKAYQKLGKLNEAMAAYNAAISVNKEFAEAYLSRGSLKIYLNQIKRACSDLRLAESLGAENAASLIKKYCN